MEQEMKQYSVNAVFDIKETPSKEKPMTCSEIKTYNGKIEDMDFITKSPIKMIMVTVITEDGQEFREQFAPQPQEI